MLKNLKLVPKFTLLLFGIFFVGLIVSGVVLWQVLQQASESEVKDKGLLLLQTMKSVRTYTSNNVSPLLATAYNNEETFIKEGVPAFSAIQVFENLRQEEWYRDFSYREAALNPTNPRDQADPFEARLLAEMQKYPERPDITGFREMNRRNFFYIARPMELTSESCLACHGDPADAPAGLIATYGSGNGFGWQVGDVIAAQIIYVPAQEVFNRARQALALVMAVVVVIFTLAILLINRLLRKSVLIPIETMGGVAQKISQEEDISAEIETDQLAGLTNRADELGWLAQVFRQMAQEVHQRTQRLKAQVEELRIEIDQIKRQETVKEIVESDSFQDLQAQIASVRQRRRQRKPKDEQSAE